MAEFRERPAGVLTIVASGVPATYLLPEVIVAFARAHPNVRVQIRAAASAQTMDALRSHQAELGVVGGFAAAPEIEAVPLVRERAMPRKGREGPQPGFQIHNRRLYEEGRICISILPPSGATLRP